MGVYIKGLEMPETCDMCPIEGCEYIYKKFTCPLIEIVRCKECKHWDDGICNHPRCEVGDTLGTEPTDFCSYGERRTDPKDCKGCKLTNECDHHICLKVVRERRTDEINDRLLADM